MNVADKIRERIRNSQNERLSVFKQYLLGKLIDTFTSENDELFIEVNRYLHEYITNDPKMIARIGQNNLHNILTFLRDNGFIANYDEFGNYIKVQLY